jgi:class 3 adenylate cyclase/tetratricopeptide (TPR) repeat protein
MDRRQALAWGRTLPDRARGAVLFADISGFTPLTAALAEELGPQQGAEEVTYQLNRVYGALIAEVQRYGGSVIGFSGDAITCWFDEATQATASSSGCATACALAMQQVMTQFQAVDTPAGATISLHIKIAVTAGAARRFLVGYPRIQTIEVLAGAIVDRVAAAEQQASQGEVIVGSEVIEQLGGQVKVSGWRSGNLGQRFAVVTALAQPVPPAPWPEAPELSADTVRNWLLPPVYQRLQRGAGEFLAELRPAVSLFLKFSGIDYDQDDEAGAKLDAYIRWIQTSLARYEGFLLQLTMGDKGSYLYVVFGAPLAHEDDPVRAVAAALALQALPPELNFIRNVQIGISRGQVHAGAYGGSLGRTYGVLGSEVNIAARLMNKAEPGQILVTGRIAAMAAADYVFQALAPAPLKGLAKPLPVFMVQDRRKDQARGTMKKHAIGQLVGRAAERDVLARHLHLLLEGQGGRILIEGDAGIGKSRLIAYLLEQAQASGLNYLLGSGEAIEQSTPYHAWRPVFSRLFGLEAPAEDADAGSRHDMRSRIQVHLAGIKPELEALAPLLNAVLALDFAENEDTASMNSEARANSTQELLVALLQDAAATRPLLLVIEDAHWLDSASWALLRLVSRDIPSALLVLALRPLFDPIPSDYVYLLNTPGTQVVQLGTLSAQETIALVCQRLGVASLPQPVASFIQERAEGHPFFSEELAYALRDAALIQIVAGQCQVAPGAGNLRHLDFPTTIEGVIISRIDRLPAQQQLTLKVASVIGRIFAFRALRDVHPVESDKPHLQEYLTNLERLDITPLETPEPDLSYLFKHVITQEVTYHLLLFAQRCALHQVVAQWYERTYSDDLTPFYPLLAHHWSNTDDKQKSIDYLGRAGGQAARIGAHDEAINFLSRALELNRQTPFVTDKKRLARWEHQLGFAYLSVGSIEESIKHFQAALAYLGRRAPTSSGGYLVGLLRQVGRQSLHRLWSQRFVGRAGDPEAALAAAHIYQDLGTAVYHMSDPLAAMYATINHLNEAEQAPPSGQLGPAYAATGVLAAFFSPQRLGGMYVRLAGKVLPDAPPPQKGFALELSGMYWAAVGNWRSAQEHIEAALPIFEGTGHRLRWQELLAQLTFALTAQGELDEASQACERLYELAVRSNNPQAQLWASVQLATVVMRQNRLEEALAALEKVAGLSDKVGHTDLIWLYGCLASAQLRHGQPEVARETAEKAQQLMAGSSPDAFYTLEGYAGVAEVTITWWPAAQDKRQQKAARRGLQALKQFALFFPVGRPRALLWQGVYLWQSGKPAKAHKTWQKALKEAERMALHYEQALIHHQIGRHLAQDHPARAHHLHQAITLFTEHGAIRDLKQVA